MRILGRALIFVFLLSGTGFARGKFRAKDFLNGIPEGRIDRTYLDGEAIDGSAKIAEESTNSLAELDMEKKGNRLRSNLIKVKSVVLATLLWPFASAQELELLKTPQENKPATFAKKTKFALGEIVLAECAYTYRRAKIYAYPEGREKSGHYIKWEGWNKDICGKKDISLSGEILRGYGESIYKIAPFRGEVRGLKGPVSDYRGLYVRYKYGYDEVCEKIDEIYVGFFSVQINWKRDFLKNSRIKNIYVSGSECKEAIEYGDKL